MDYRIRDFRRYADLPPSYRGLLAATAEKGFFHSEAWFGFMLEYEWIGSQLRLFAVEDENAIPLLLAPMRSTELDGAVPYAQTLASIGHQENYSEMSLVFAPALDSQARCEILKALYQSFRYEQGIDVLRLWPVETESALSLEVAQGLKGAGYWVQAYNNSFNRYEETEGLSFEDYLASRSSNQRYNIRRRERNMNKAGELEIRIYTGQESPEELRKGFDDYILGTVESWKNPGSMVGRAMLLLMRMAAENGCLRMGVLKFEGRPIAGQFWLVSAGIAHTMRLAYHEDYKKWAPGVVLTSHLIAHVLDVDHVARIDFGMGDEDYKEKWMRSSRDYAGYMAFNPRTPRGIFFAAKHIAGQKIKRVILRAIKFLLRPLLGPQ